MEVAERAIKMFRKVPKMLSALQEGTGGETRQVSWTDYGFLKIMTVLPTAAMGEVDGSIGTLL